MFPVPRYNVDTIGRGAVPPGPADFWLFQAIETGIFVAAAALLLYLAIRRIRRIV